jgi:hypothetical protein
LASSINSLQVCNIELLKQFHLLIIKPACGLLKHL